jgi:hypothetical protein
MPTSGTWCIDAVDGLVGRVVQIGGFWVAFPAIARRDGGEVDCLGTGDHVDLAEFLSFGDGLLRPLSGVQIVRFRLAAQQVHGNHGELAGRAALQEQHLVMGGDVEQFAQIGLGLFGDGDEFLAAMAHFHHRHAGTVPVEHLGLGLFQNRLGQHGGTRAKVIWTWHVENPSLPH